MGVSGCGKSTIAEIIASQLGAVFLDADDLHPPENKKLMSDGVPLSDENRMPWLEAVREHANTLAQSNICVIACSALKKKYRDVLNSGEPVHYVFLDGPKSLIQERIHARSGHFMPESLLDSQFEALESPVDEDNVLTIGIEGMPKDIAHQAISALVEAKVIKPS